MSAKVCGMVQGLLNQSAVDEVSARRDAYIKAYQLMLLARMLDDKFASLYRMGKIHGGVFLGRGQEALSVATGLALRKGDIFAPLIRDGAGRLAFGEPILEAAFHKKGTISVMLMLLLLGSVMISSGFGVLLTGKPSDSPRSWMWFGLGLMVVLTMILFWILGEMGYPYRYR